MAPVPFPPPICDVRFTSTPVFGRNAHIAVIRRQPGTGQVDPLRASPICSECAETLRKRRRRNATDAPGADNGLRRYLEEARHGSVRRQMTTANTRSKACRRRSCSTALSEPAAEVVFGRVPVEEPGHGRFLLVGLTRHSWACFGLQRSVCAYAFNEFRLQHRPAGRSIWPGLL
jgi:hypothetical protein